jgi:hypothetical protein
MSDLVERVARAICLERAAPACRCTKETGCQANTQSLMNHTERPAQARAAIKAVAEWVREAGGDDMYARAFSKMIFDELKEGSE